ncbi:hypothetical protein LU674_017460 [Pseudomonas alloputida]|uniref:Uncharacterized protein n=2 Tax=Pseudomonas TaxID=286 RepID=A0A7W2JGW3_9PSED|nr:MULTISPECIES: hypothetical protein [Pseudomonas]MBA1216397.1 hypothetical protein [Pseudomonas fulva]MBA1319552.1 hypothetical protein [Pseudomonas monteilii]MBA6058778.1 hypothetical protein [Pseudomonas juntendi]MBA6105405.1 hypothetical protein [Pseudomonas monteilii]MBA6126011.1 hypothetical protein [Pseudomonas juntendi]
MSDEVVIEYHVKELSDFQLNRIARAMAQQYPVPITAYLSDVFISSECAAGIVFGHNDPGPHEQHADGHILQTAPIYQLRRFGRFWVASTNSGNYVLATFNRGSGRASLRALIEVADKPGQPAV